MRGPAVFVLVVLFGAEPASLRGAAQDDRLPEPLEFASGETVPLKDVMSWPEYAKARVSVDPKSTLDWSRFPERPSPREIPAEERKKMVADARERASQVVDALHPETPAAPEAWKVIEPFEALSTHLSLYVPLDPRSPEAARLPEGSPWLSVMFLLRDGALEPGHVDIRTMDSGKLPRLDDESGWVASASKDYARLFGQPVVGKAKVHPASDPGPFLHIRWIPEWRKRPLPQRHWAQFFVQLRNGVWIRSWTVGSTPEKVERLLRKAKGTHIRVSARDAAAAAVRNLAAMKSESRDARIDDLRIASVRVVLPEAVEHYANLRARSLRFFDTPAVRAAAGDDAALMVVWEVRFDARRYPLRNTRVWIDPESGRVLAVSDSMYPW